MTLPDDLREELRRMEARFGADDTDLLVAFEDPKTGELTDADGNPIDDSEAGPLVVIERGLVMFREQAEREGYEILGPAENAARDDVVRVVPKDR